MPCSACQRAKAFSREREKVERLPSPRRFNTSRTAVIDMRSLQKSVQRSQLGNAVSNVIGNTLATKMLVNRNLDTGTFLRAGRDPNPCKGELDEFIIQAKVGGDTVRAGERLRDCALQNYEYFTRGNTR